MAGGLTVNNIFICTKHFRENIVRVEWALQADGSYTETSRIYPTYHLNAVLIIFPYCPFNFFG